MKLLKKLFGSLELFVPMERSDEEEVEITFDVPRFTPKEDITAYEVALYLTNNKTFVFTGDVKKYRDDLVKWVDSLPASLIRHHTFVKHTVKVPKSLLTNFEK